MSKIKVGDRIAVYESCEAWGRKTGTVIEVREKGILYYKLDAGGEVLVAHPKQCRKLVKRAPLRKRVGVVLRYCEPHIEVTWAAQVVGYLLDCDFRDASQKLKEYFEKKNEN